MKSPLRHALLCLAAAALIGCGGDATETNTDPGTSDSESTPDVLGSGEADTTATTEEDSGPTDPVDPTPTPDVTEEEPETTTPDPVEDVVEPEPEPEEDAGPGPDPVEDTSDPEPDPEPEPDVEEPIDLCGDGTCDPTEDCTSCAGDCPTCRPEPGDLLITEIMQNPKSVSDDTGEWIEVLNIGSAPVELAGVLLRDDDLDQHLIAPMPSLVIAPGEYVVLGASDDIGGVASDYTWFDYSLGNGSDAVILEVDGVIIDAVSYDNGATFPDPNGASMSLSPETMTPEGNDDSGNWCAGQTEFASGDKGTPGEPNPTCVVCGDGSCDASEVCETCPDDCGSCTPCDQGATATDETCNGVDDDCDGSVDNGVGCDDGVACTEDYCDGASGCASEPADGSCFIAGTCYAEGDTNPANTCEVCDPGVTKDSWASKLLSFDCEDGDPCTENEKCVAGFCILGEPVPGDNFEPNDSQEAALVLGDIQDDNEFPAGTFNGSLFPEGDIDWYTFHDEDIVTNISLFRPKVELISPFGTDYRMCTFATCDNGEEPDIVDCEGGVEWSAEEGLFGCCASGSEYLSIKMSVQCTWQGTLSDSSDVHIRVENQSDEWSCDDYELSWGDD
ncbi:MAG: lamin tail domain-containing protein [Myxococcota bacterium]